MYRQVVVPMLVVFVVFVAVVADVVVMRALRWTMSSHDPTRSHFPHTPLDCSWLPHLAGHESEQVRMVVTALVDDQERKADAAQHAVQW